MELQTLLLLKLIFIYGLCSAQHCNKATPAQAREGNLGQSAVFNWLGVLNVHVQHHKWDKLRIATSGIALIRIKYALINADDVARIPQSIFKTNSWAMFLSAQNTPWSVKPASYVTHPEYEYSSLNSIAIIELDLREVKDFPLTPVCLPTTDTFNASTNLYLTGFTYENDILEKIIYKIQYLDKKVCEEYYNRTELASQNHIPSAYLCGYAPNIVRQCVWENGMALVSNAKGYLNLIGFGVHGPGCAAPARFIDLFPYFYWINSITGPDEVDHRRKGSDIESIPISELYTMSGARRQSILAHDYEKYPFDVESLKFYIIKPTEDRNTIAIEHFSHDNTKQYGQPCTVDTNLVYREDIDLKVYKGVVGTAIYKLTLYDLAYYPRLCVLVTANCCTRSQVILSYKESINFKENVRLREQSGETPEEIFRYFPLPDRTVEPYKMGEDKERTQALFINDFHEIYRKLINSDLYIKFKFVMCAKLTFKIFAKPYPKPSKPTTNSKLIRRKAKTRPKSDWGMVNWADKIVRVADVEDD